MASSLFGRPIRQQSNGNLSANPNGARGNIFQQFAQFKRMMQGKDPEKIVMEMLSNGQMSQEQFEKFKSQAQSLSAILR